MWPLPVICDAHLSTSSGGFGEWLLCSSGWHAGFNQFPVYSTQDLCQHQTKQPIPFLLWHSRAQRLQAFQRPDFDFGAGVEAVADVPAGKGEVRKGSGARSFLWQPEPICRVSCHCASRPAAYFSDLVGKLGHDVEEEVGKGGDWQRKQKVERQESLLDTQLVVFPDIPHTWREAAMAKLSACCHQGQSVALTPPYGHGVGCVGVWSQSGSSRTFLTGANSCPAAATGLGPSS